MWELGWNSPISEFDLWNFPLREFEVDEFCMTPISGIDRKVTEFASIEEGIASFPELVPIVFDERGEVDLEEFKHPQDALYIFGKANYSPLINLDCMSVSIRTPQNKGMMWPHQVATMVLYNRWIKSWQ